MFKIIKTGLLIVGFLSISLFIFQPSLSAQSIPAGCPGGPPGQLAEGTVCPDTPKKFKTDCNQPAALLNKDNCKIINYLVTFIRVLSGIVGIVIVIMVAVGGVQYSSARDNPQQAAAAKNRIINALMALVFYLFAFAFLQWLIPGGIVR